MFRICCLLHLSARSVHTLGGKFPPSGCRLMYAPTLGQVRNGKLQIAGLSFPGQKRVLSHKTCCSTFPISISQKLDGFWLHSRGTGPSTQQISEHSPEPGHPQWVGTSGYLENVFIHSTKSDRAFVMCQALGLALGIQN